MTTKTSAEKRARVLAMAEAVFLQQGYAQTTMGDLAEAAGMSRPALYLVYARKHELFAAIVEEAGRGQVGEIEPWMMWVCDLWLGELSAPGGAREGEVARGHQRPETFMREANFLNGLLEQGLAQRIPWRVEPQVRAAAARLLTFCVCGLQEARLGAREGRALLRVQVQALAETTLRRPDGPADGVARAPHYPTKLTKGRATAAQVAAAG